ncbi:hypothetical protein BI364_13940 [Acidihalobacter yilgarnensis]|uniref:Uncharacterized protein n=1 Tax=Acidihalobacter yilgarnensis TaxID=2819280 RepID=A0A1D8IQY7_9GAMM|nr:S-layer family protein [Acidihalobacter yilgarnensis]AOU98909.1 hypothetical protein BI364_13940 [Acidihalobacter yilgarnensis]
MALDGPLNVAAGRNLTLDTTGAVTQTAGLTAGNLLLQGGGPVTLTNAGNAVGTVAGTTGALELVDTNGLTVGTVGGVVGLTATGDVGLNAPSLSLTNALNGKAGATLRLSPLNTSASIGLAGGSGTYTLTTSDLSNISNFGVIEIGSTTGTGQITLGSTGLTVPAMTDLSLLSGGTGSGGVALNGALTLGAGKNLQIDTTGAVTQTAGLTAGNLLLQGGGPVTLTNAGNAVGTVAGTTGALDLVDTNGLTVGTVGGVVGLTATGDVGLQTGSGGLALNADVNVGSNLLKLDTTGAVTQTAGLTAGNLLLQGGGPVTLTNAGNAVGTVAGTTGALDLVDTNGLTVGTVGGVVGLTATGDVGLQTGSGGLALNADVNVGSNLLKLDTTGAVTQTAGLTAGNLLLQGGGPVTLTNAGNAVGTVAGTTGALDLVDTNGLTVGTVGGVAGLTATGDVGLQTGSGGLALNADVNVGSNLLKLDTTGAVTQTAGLTAGNLLLQGGGPVTLTNAGNAVGTMAGTTGALDLVDTNGLTVGTVGGVAGLTATGDVGLQTGSGGLALNADVNVGSNLLKLDTTGAVTQTAGLTAGNLLLQGGGPVTLTNAGNAVGTVAGTTGALDLVDTNGLTVGTVGGVAGLTATGDVGLQTGSGGLALNADVNVGSNLLKLDTTGAVTQTAGLTAGNLLLQGGGPVTLTNAGNAVGTVAGTTGALELVDTNGLTVGTVGGVVGLTATGDVGLNAPSLSLTNALNGNAGATLRLSPLNTSASIGLAGGSGTYTLTTSDLSNISNFGVIEIGSTTGTGQITLGSAGLTVPAMTDLSLLSGGTGSGGVALNGALTLGAGKNLQIDTTGAVTQTVGSANNPGINANSVRIQGGTLSLGNIHSKSLVAKASGVVTLNGTLGATDNGNALIVVTEGGFENNAGSSALVTPNGRWLVYLGSQNLPLKENGLGKNELFGYAWADNPNEIPSGNYFIYPEGVRLTTILGGGASNAAYSESLGYFQPNAITTRVKWPSPQPVDRFISTLLTGVKNQRDTAVTCKRSASASQIVCVTE